MTLNMNQIRQLINMRKERELGFLTFRAGRLKMDLATKMVTADTKRGKIKFVRSDEGIVHLQWFNRISNQKELDLSLFPSTSRWEKIKECKDGRVYLLRMFGSNRKWFFWMQEPTDEKDDEYFEKINKICNGEAIAEEKSKGTGKNKAGAGGAAAALLAGRGGGAPQINAQQMRAMQNAQLMQQRGAGGGMGLPGQNPNFGAAFANALGGGAGGQPGMGMDATMLQQQQLMELIRMSNPRAAANANNAQGQQAQGQQGTGGGASQAQNLQQLIMDALAGNIPANANANNTNANANNNTAAAQRVLASMNERQRAAIEELKQEPDLEDILDASSNEEIPALLSDAQLLSELVSHLPAEMRSREDVIEQLQSPQFQGSLRRLQAVMNSPQMGTLLAQLGLQPASNTFADNIGVRAFIRAVQTRANAENAQSIASNAVTATANASENSNASAIANANANASASANTSSNNNNNDDNDAEMGNNEEDNNAS